MAILTRFTRLLKADLHALLDRMEAPDVLLQQALREMEAELQALQLQQRQRCAQQQQIQHQLAQVQQQLAQYQQELTLCLEHDSDSLARSLLRRQLEAEQRLQMLQGQLQTLQCQCQQTDEQISARQASLEALQLQADSLLDTADAQPVALHDQPRRISDADIELALLKAKSARRPA